MIITLKTTLRYVQKICRFSVERVSKEIFGEIRDIILVQFFFHFPQGQDTHRQSISFLTG